MDLAEFIAARLDDDQAAITWYIAEVPNQGPQFLAAIDYDGERLLREVAAKRAILAMHHDCGSGIGRCDDGGHGLDGIGCGDLLYMAAVWSDHPDYRAEWKP